MKKISRKKTKKDPQYARIKLAAPRKIKNKKIIFLVALLCFIVVLFSFLTVLFYNTYMILYYDEISTDVKVPEGNIVGLNADADALHFGKVPLGGSSWRDVIISYPSRDVIVQFKIQGNISDFVIVSHNNFLLLKNETKRVTFYIDIPRGTPYSYYNGTIAVYYKRPSLFS